MYGVIFSFSFLILSIITIGENKTESIKQMTDALNAIIHNVGPIQKLDLFEENKKKLLFLFKSLIHLFYGRDC